MGEMPPRRSLDSPCYGKSLHRLLYGLREKRPGLSRQDVLAELRAAAARNVELITALISFNRQLALVGLQLDSNGAVCS